MLLARPHFGGGAALLRPGPHAPRGPPGDCGAGDLRTARFEGRLLDALVGDHGELHRLACVGNPSRLMPQAEQVLVARLDAATSSLVAVAANAHPPRLPVELRALELAAALVDSEALGTHAIRIHRADAALLVLQTQQARQSLGLQVQAHLVLATGNAPVVAGLAATEPLCAVTDDRVAPTRGRQLAG